MPDQTSQNLGRMLTSGLYTNDGFDILKRNPEMLEYSPDGKEVKIHSTVGKALQGFKKSKICQETQEVENLLEKFYSNDPNVQVIRSDNVTKLCSPPPSGGTKSRRRKFHNKRASRSKSKTQRRRRARMSHR